MKKYRWLFPVLIFFLVISVLSLPVSADEMWSEEYYRAYDTTGTLTEEEQQEVDQIACEFIEKYHYDLISMTVTSDSYEGSLEEWAEDFYTGNGFGYGDDASGVICAYDVDQEQMVFLKFGSAGEHVPDSLLEFMADHIPEFYESNQAFGIMYGFEAYMQKYEDGELDELLGVTSENQESSAAAETKAASEAVVSRIREGDPFWECLQNSGVERVGDSDASLPYWYPTDTENFEFYNDPDIPRVVDDADIFTDEEEEQMAQLIAEIVPEAGADIVIFTDNSDYGFGHNIYAADFYDFNGYGIGDENEGICLMICMEQGNRGWYACATGTDTRSLYTEDNANDLDDKLYTYMSVGNYAEGVLDWIGNIRTLYTKGIPFAPEWYPDRDETLPQVTADDPRVLDYAGLFTAEQLDELAAEAKKLSEKYGLDVVITTAEDDYNMGDCGYCDAFYEMNGFGFGENHDGFCLTLYYGRATGMSYFGKAADKITELNFERIMDYTSDAVWSGGYYEAAKTWLSDIAHMERTGRVRRPLYLWIISVVFAAVFAFLFSLIALHRAKKKMVTVNLSYDADDYISGQPSVTKIRDIFLRYHVTRVPRPKDTGSSGSSGGSSSSSHSSYHSSYSGSSGRSHSGSGRSF